MSVEEKDSMEELYFEWYLQELKDAGIVNNFFFHPAKFDLVSSTTYELYTGLKRKPSLRVLCSRQTYTPDFLITWNKHDADAAKFFKIVQEIPETTRLVADDDEADRFFWAQPKPIAYSTYVDIKPQFQRQQSRTAVFSLKRAIMLEKFRLNVQAVIYQNLFEKTFTPQRFLRCDKSNKVRKINFPVRSLEEFLK